MNTNVGNVLTAMVVITRDGLFWCAVILGIDEITGFWHLPFAHHLYRSSILWRVIKPGCKCINDKGLLVSILVRSRWVSVSPMLIFMYFISSVHRRFTGLRWVVEECENRVNRNRGYWWTVLTVRNRKSGFYFFTFQGRKGKTRPGNQGRVISLDRFLILFW